MIPKAIFLLSWATQILYYKLQKRKKTQSDQNGVLAYVVAAEAVIALLLTLPSPKLVKSRIVSLISLILQPAIGIVPFAAFQLLGSLKLGFCLTKIRACSFLYCFVLIWIFFSLIWYVFRYLLEEWTQVDVHFWCMHCCWERQIWEIRKSSNMIPLLLVYSFSQS